jgi:hypothetical protein
MKSVFVLLGIVLMLAGCQSAPEAKEGQSLDILMGFLNGDHYYNPSLGTGIVFPQGYQLQKINPGPNQEVAPLIYQPVARDTDPKSSLYYFAVRAQDPNVSGNMLFFYCDLAKGPVSDQEAEKHSYALMEGTLKEFPQESATLKQAGVQVGERMFFVNSV